MTLLLLFGPIGFLFLLLMSMARYERWALDTNEAKADTPSVSVPVPSKPGEAVPRSRRAERWVPVAD